MPAIENNGILWSEWIKRRINWQRGWGMDEYNEWNIYPWKLEKAEKKETGKQRNKLGKEYNELDI